jgi:RNA polymerase sigma-70 factor (ECF subfamily)
VTLHQVPLFRFLLARCSNKHDAEDVLQETFMSAYKYIHSYKEQWQFNTWLFTIAKRLIKNQNIYYDSNNQEFCDNQELSLLNEVRNISEDNIWILIKKIIKEDAYDTLWLFYVEQMSLKEIAKVLKRSQSWVKISLFRSKKQLSQNSVLQNLSEDVI